MINRRAGFEAMSPGFWLAFQIQGEDADTINSIIIVEVVQKYWFLEVFQRVKPTIFENGFHMGYAQEKIKDGSRMCFLSKWRNMMKLL
jgi:hypothetical protein